MPFKCQFFFIIGFFMLQTGVKLNLSKDKQVGS